MLLAKLRIRQKLVLLVLPPLLLIVIGTVPLVLGRVQTARDAGGTAQIIRNTIELSTVIQELQQERLVSLSYLADRDAQDRITDRSRLTDRSARVLDAASDSRIELGDRLTPAVSKLLANLGAKNGLGGVRSRVLTQNIGPDEVYQAFGTAIRQIVNALGLATDADLRSVTGQRELALDALIRHDEATSAGGAAVVMARALGKMTDRVVALVAEQAALQDREEGIFRPLAGPVSVSLFQQVKDGPANTQVKQFLDRVIATPDVVVKESAPADIVQATESLTTISRLVQDKLSNDSVRLADADASRARLIAGLVIAAAILGVALVAALGLTVARSIAAPLRRLTRSADEVAAAAQAELIRVVDEENMEEVTPPQLVPVEVISSDELGELAEAFNRVQQVASDLVERQALSRRNVATMFGNVGRRTQNLVGRQLAMIDSLERNEQDPGLLDRLYRLDHVSTRLRRNANSLVVLSGAAEPSLLTTPMPIGNAIRSALGEIEGYQRVRVNVTDDVLLAPNVSGDVILLLAELLENGTSFSPPTTDVEANARRVDDGILVTIVDHGIGMTEVQLEDENARLVERERLDLAPTDVLGLFVAGRLARRHGVHVTLHHSDGTGVTAEVLIPARYIVGDETPADYWRGSPGSLGQGAAGSTPEDAAFGSVSFVDAEDADADEADRGGSVGEADLAAADRTGSALPGVRQRQPYQDLSTEVVGLRSTDPFTIDALPVDPVDQVDPGAPVDTSRFVPERDWWDTGDDPASSYLDEASPVGGPVPAGPAGSASANGANGVGAVGFGQFRTDASAPELPAGPGSPAAAGADHTPPARTHDSRTGSSVPGQPLANLRRRIRGAQLPDTGVGRVPDRRSQPSETPEEARQLIADFEDGVRRAQEAAAAGPPSAQRSVPPPRLSESSADSVRASVQELNALTARALQHLAEVTARHPNLRDPSWPGANDSVFYPPAHPPAEPADAPPSGRPAGAERGTSTSAPKRSLPMDATVELSIVRPPAPDPADRAEPPGSTESTAPAGSTGATKAVGSERPDGSTAADRGNGRAGEAERGTSPGGAEVRPLRPGDDGARTDQGTPSRPDTIVPAARQGSGQHGASPGPTRTGPVTSDPDGAGAGPTAQPVRAARNAGDLTTAQPTGRDTDGPVPPGRVSDRVRNGNGASRLSRRVPGAQLPLGVGRSNKTLASPPEQDPAAARALIEDFEAGVARALESVRDDGLDVTTEGDSR